MLAYIIYALSAVLALALTVPAGGLWWLLAPVVFGAATLLLLALAFGFLLLMCAFVDQEKPQQQDSRFYRALAHITIDAVICFARVRLHTRGLEKTPKDGRFLLVCNHLNDVDPALLMHVFPKSQLAYISKRENKTMLVVGKVMHKLLCPLVNRENDREALKTILHAIDLIREDKVSIGVFPEGYVSKSGKLLPFRGGVFKIAQRAEVPIVVCTIQNTKTVVPNLLKLRPSDVELHLVDVIPAQELRGRTAVSIAQQVYDLMLSDLGPEFAPEEVQNT